MQLKVLSTPFHYRPYTKRSMREYAIATIIYSVKPEGALCQRNDTIGSHFCSKKSFTSWNLIGQIEPAKVLHATPS